MRWALVIDPDTAIASELLLTCDYPKTNQSIKNVEKYIYLNFDNARKMETDGSQPVIELPTCHTTPPLKD